MELGKQIKRYRSELGMFQDTLAEKIYVSRQTVSNWENDKNYPDINSLLRLSEVFHISIDILIRGDVEKMKKEFDIQTYKEIVAFGEGKMLDEITKAREEGKRPYQKLLLAAGSALIALAAALLMGWMLYICVMLQR